MPSKVRLLSKVLLKAMSLLASYVLVNASSPPVRGDGTEESRAESQLARREVMRPGRSKVAFISSDKSCAKESLRRTSWRPRGVLQLPREDTERAESRRGDASAPVSPSVPLAAARKGRRPAGARLVLLRGSDNEPVVPSNVPVRSPSSSSMRLARMLIFAFSPALSVRLRVSLASGCCVTQGDFDDRGRLSARSIEWVMSIVWFKVGLLPSKVLVEALLAS